MAEAGQLTNVELGPAYRIINAYGGAGSIADAAKNDPQNFASAVGIANLPDGQGLSALTQMAQTSSGASQALATEMIAQLAGQNPQAVNTLVQMQQKGQIGNNVWVQMAPLLAGNQYQVHNSTDPNASGGQTGSSGSTYSLVNTLTTSDDINQRIALIDQFLGMVTPGSSAAAALQQQRTILSKRLGN